MATARTPGAWLAGKIPYVTHGDKKFGDSELVMRYLTNTYLATPGERRGAESGHEDGEGRGGEGRGSHGGELGVHWGRAATPLPATTPWLPPPTHYRPTLQPASRSS